MESENPPVPSTNKPKRGRLWSWLRRLFISGSVLLLLAVIFHQPLLRWAINSLTPWLASKAGYNLQWQVTGSVTSDLSVKSLTLSGPEKGALTQITLEGAGLDYDFWQLVKGPRLQALKRLSLQDATVEIDARPKPDAPPKKPSTRKPGPPPDAWISEINIERVTAKIQTARGDIQVKDFTLQALPEETGDLKIAELVIPSANIHLKEVSAKTRLEHRRLVITDLSILPEVQIERLAVDLEDLSNGEVLFELLARSGQALVKASGNANGIGTKMGLDAELQLTGFSQVEAARWRQLPDNLAWNVQSLTAQIKGQPSSPRSLDAQVSLDIAGIRVNRLPESTISLKADLKDGRLKVETLELHAGANQVVASAEAEMPETWAESRNISSDVILKVDAPKLEDFATPSLALAGKASMDGKISLLHGKLDSAKADLSADGLSIAGYSISRINAQLAGTPAMVNLQTAKVQFDDKNQMSLSGQLSLNERKPVTMNWQASVPDLPLLTRSLRLPENQQADSGELDLQGQASFELADLQQKDLSKILVETNGALSTVSWQGRELQSAVIKATLKAGKLQAGLNINQNEKNTAQLEAGLSLLDDQPGNMQWQVSLLDLAAISKMAGLKNVPLPEAGSVISTGKADFSLKALRESGVASIQAEAGVNLDDLVWQKERFEGLKADIVLRDQTAHIQALNVVLNERNTLNASGQVNLKSFVFNADLKGALNQLTDFNPWLLLASKFKPQSPVLDPQALVPLPGDPQPSTPLLPQPDTESEKKLFDKDKSKPTPEPFQFAGGTLTLNWQGGGSVKDLDIRGSGAVQADKIKIKGRPQQFALQLETKHEGKRAEITRLQATADDLKAELTASVSETDLNIPSLTLTAGNTRLIDGTASIPLKLKSAEPVSVKPLDASRPLAVHLHMKELGFEEIFNHLGIKPPVQGRAALNVDLTGSLNDLNGNVALSLKSIRTEAVKGKLQPASMDLNITIAQNRINLAAQAVQPPLNPLTITADMPMVVNEVLANATGTLDAPLKAQVTLPASDLSFVRSFVPALNAIKGTVEVNVAIAGTPRAPKWDGHVVTQIQEAVLEGVDMVARDARLRLRLMDRRMTLEELHAQLAGGEIHATGTADFEDMKNPAFDLRLTAKEALLMRDETLSQRADVELSCKGTLEQAHVEGDVRLVRGRVFKEVEFLPLSLPNQLPPPPPPVRHSTAKPSAPPPFDKWTFNIGVKTKDNIRLLGNVLNGGVIVDMRAAGTGAQPEIEGKVSLNGARLQLPFSRVAITKGDIVFTKDKPLDPQLDLMGESLVNGYQITLYAYGSALAPKTRFTSSPPLKEGDIATLLATGVTAEDVGSSEGVAANRAAFLLISQTYRKLFNKGTRLRKDEEPPKFSFSFNPLSTGTSQRAVTGTYEISPKVQLSGTVMESGSFRGLVYYLIRFR